MASLELPKGMRTLQGVPEVSRYHNLSGNPYSSVNQVLTEVLPVANRYVGQTFNVAGTEYWFEGGINNSNLKEKSPDDDIRWESKEW